MYLKHFTILSLDFFFCSIIQDQILFCQQLQVFQAREDVERKAEYMVIASRIYVFPCLVTDFLHATRPCYVAICVLYLILTQHITMWIAQE